MLGEYYLQGAPADAWQAALLQRRGRWHTGRPRIMHKRPPMLPECCYECWVSCTRDHLSLQSAATNAWRAALLHKRGTAAHSIMWRAWPHEAHSMAWKRPVCSQAVGRHAHLPQILSFGYRADAVSQLCISRAEMVAMGDC